MLFSGQGPLSRLFRPLFRLMANRKLAETMVAIVPPLCPNASKSDRVLAASATGCRYALFGAGALVAAVPTVVPADPAQLAYGAAGVPVLIGTQHHQPVGGVDQRHADREQHRKHQDRRERHAGAGALVAAVPTVVPADPAQLAYGAAGVPVRAGLRPGPDVAQDDEVHDRDGEQEAGRDDGCDRPAALPGVMRSMPITLPPSTMSPAS
jgi:hypothetical protein